MVGTSKGLKNAIDDNAEKIIRHVNTFAKQIEWNDMDRKEGKKQFTELIEAAGQACCINEFQLYITYKGSKEGTRKIWGNLVKPFNDQINSLMDEVAVAIENILESKENEREHIRLEVLKRFCGYLMWRTHADIETAKKTYTPPKGGARR
jgi:hypothetical protein